MEKVFTIESTEELNAKMTDLVNHLGAPGVVLLYGEMGVGKTTFVTAVCRELGVKDPVSSPTFSLHNIYHDPTGREIYHLDLYRLESVEEFLEAGLEETLHHDHWTFIEWPQIAEPFLTEDCKKVYFKITDEGSRIISILTPESGNK